ncbi:MAG: hydroxymethylbilane synthase [Vicinamibacterales bacterium]|nr:hydroxymethylbilane synthase [Vicinamibacterales bacterium]
MKILRLGTRGSQLALYQARLVAKKIKSAGGPDCQIVIIRTSGDQLQERPLSEVGGKGLFVKEIEDALLRADIDLAVHSSKDMSAVLPDGLDIGAVLRRVDPADVAVLPAGKHKGRITIEALAKTVGRSGRIGTGSARRIAQLAPLFPGAVFHNVRGNVETRLRKLDAGEYDVLVLAAAGLHRLGYGSRISTRLPVKSCIPSPGQGIIAVEVRRNDKGVRNAVRRINDADTAAALQAERALVVALGGGCQMPLGGLATHVGTAALKLQAVVASPEGHGAVRAWKVLPKTQAARLGRDVGTALLAAGAADILRA